MFMKTALSIVLFLLVRPAVPVYGQQPLSVNFSDTSRPGLLKVNLVNGRIAVRAHAGTDVLIETSAPGNRNRGSSPVVRGGLRRIESNTAGLTVEEENNVMTVTTRDFSSASLEIQVPTKTNLNLKTQNGGDITIEGVEGEIEVTNINGNAVLNNVAGSVVAHSSNGRVIASLREVTPNKPMYLTSTNGNVDLTLPAAVKANLKMRTDNGATYSDFEIQLRPTPPPTIRDQRNQGGGFLLQTDKTINGTINGGGPDFDLRTLNGNIYIRKGK
jgi:hypothetical protein